MGEAGTKAFLHCPDSKIMVTMGASEGPPQQQLAVLALVGVVAFILIVGAVLLYRFRSSSVSQKTDETQVALRMCRSSFHGF